MKLTDDQKTVLELLKHYYDISPSDEEVVIDSYELRFNVNANKVDLILKKFAKDYGIIDYTSGELYSKDKYIRTKIFFTDDFESFYNEHVTKEEEREEQARREWQEEQNGIGTEFDAVVFSNSEGKKTNTDESKMYWLDYSDKSRKLILNDCILIAKTNLNSAPDNFLSYIFKNPNREISLAEIQDEGKAEIKRDFHKILDDLNFKGVVRKLFFDVSKTTITFHNPVSKKQMQEVGIELIQLSDFIRNNPK